MKRLFDFTYCRGVYTPQHVWFRVRVGTSARDRAALRRLSRLASSNPAVFLARHCTQVEAFRLSLAAAILPGIQRPGALMRVAHVDVSWLASFIRRYPLALLNSTRISTPVTVPAMVLSGWRSSASILVDRAAIRRFSPALRQDVVNQK